MISSNVIGLSSNFNIFRQFILNKIKEKDFTDHTIYFGECETNLCGLIKHVNKYYSVHKGFKRGFGSIWIKHNDKIIIAFSASREPISLSYCPEFVKFDFKNKHLNIKSILSDYLDEKELNEFLLYYRRVLDILGSKRIRLEKICL